VAYETMGDAHNSKPGSRPGIKPPSSAAGKKPERSDGPLAGGAGTSSKAGRVVHDERGNAIWHWVKDTARIAIDSTSRLLKKLEVPELKLEDSHTEELRIESDRDAGGGYDPYGTSSSPGGRASGVRTVGTPTPPGGSGRSGPDRGGGYDPYGKSLTHKPTRKV
jgi:hypothetical protein